MKFWVAPYAAFLSRCADANSRGFFIWSWDGGETSLVLDVERGKKGHSDPKAVSFWRFHGWRSSINCSPRSLNL